MSQEKLKNRLASFVRIGKLIACLIALYYIIAAAGTVVYAVRGPFEPLSLLPGLLQAALGIALIVLSLSILFDVGKTAQPFTMQNVRRLRVIAWLLVFFEPVSALVVRLYEWLSRPVFTEGMSVRVHSSFGMVLVAVGFAVMALSFVFEYGVGLQQLEDETL